MSGVKEKIGIGIITCNRPDFLIRLLESLQGCNWAELIIVNDGNEIDIGEYNQYVHKNKKSLHVGMSKNVAMKHLLDKGCDYIFTMEDDIFIKDINVFENYIETSKKTGIQHFNFGFSQRENLDANLQPLIKKIVEYDKDTRIILTQNILGAFTFYTRYALQLIGLHHTNFNKGHGDHPELTYRAYKHGLTTPFWWFADVDKSWDMIGNLSNLGDDSLVRNQKNFINNFNEANELFKELHGYRMVEVPDVSQDKVMQILKDIKIQYGR